MKHLLIVRGILFAAACGLLAGTISGCGGHGSGPGAGVGGAGIRIYWPPLTRVIPNNTDRIVVTAYSQTVNPVGPLQPIPDVSPYTATAPGPQGGWTYGTIDGLPETSDETIVVLVANAYSKQDSTNVVATATVGPIVITPPRLTTTSITLDSTITHFKALVNGALVVDLSSSPGIHLPIDSSATVQFQAFDADDNVVLLPLVNRQNQAINDLSIQASGDLLAEAKQTAIHGTDRVTISGKHQSDSGSVTLSDTAQSLFTPATLNVTFDDVSRTLQSTFTSDTDALGDISAATPGPGGSLLYGIFEAVDYARSADFNLGSPTFAGLGFTWLNGWSAPSNGDGRIAFGGVSDTGEYVGLAGAKKLARLSTADDFSINRNLLDIDSKQGTDLYSLTAGSPSLFVGAFDGTGSTVASEQFSFQPAAMPASASIAVTFMPVTPVLGQARQKTAVYVAYGKTIKRFVGGVNDTTFHFTSDGSIVDISADGPLLYVLALDSSNAPSLSITALTWDGTELDSSPIGLGGLAQANTLDTIVPLRLVARSGSVYVGFKARVIADQSTIYGTAVAR